MFRIGIAGIGFMGMIHFQAIKRIAGAEVTAIAARDPKKRSGDWTMIQGNFGPRGAHEDLSKVTTFETADELIWNADVDLVDICLPSNDHVHPVISALEAGKHVLVEKPIALTLADADRMVAAAKASGKMLLVAHVLPFFSDFKFALDAIKSGKYGKVLAAHFRRHISPPAWSDAVSDLAKMGGPLIDLHIHDTHFIVAACGRPDRVFSSGIIDHDAVTYVSTEYLYDGDGPKVSATSGCLSQPSRPFTHGYEIYLEKGTFHYEAGYPLKVYTPEGLETPALAGGDEIDSFKEEISAAIQAVKTNTTSPLLDGQMARDALSLCIHEGESVATGKAIEVR